MTSKIQINAVGRQQRTPSDKTSSSERKISRNYLRLENHNKAVPVKQGCRTLKLVTKSIAPATCGEFVQGAIDGKDFLVNCPINLYSYAEAHKSGNAGCQLNDPLKFSKIAAATAHVALKYDLDMAHVIHVYSDIPRGKGMASSTADISAALHCVADSLFLQLSLQEFAKILTEIEPSDCVHFPGIAHVNHLTGKHIESMPAPHNLRALIVDCGGEVDTVAFDRDRARGIYRENQIKITEALYTLKRGLYRNDNYAIARAATMSAELSQLILYKPQFNELLIRSTALGALGVNCAHSGTVLGILYEGNKYLHKILYEEVRENFGDHLKVVGDYQIISGGCHAQ